VWLLAACGWRMTEGDGSHADALARRTVLPETGDDDAVRDRHDGDREKEQKHGDEREL